MPQYLYRVRPTRVGFYETPTPEEIHAVDEHFLYLKRWAEEGTVLLAGRTLNEDRAGFGIVIFEASDEQEGRRFMQEDPAVRAGVFEAELFPYHVALRSSGARRRADPRFPESVAGVVDPEPNLVVARPGRRVVGGQGHDDRFSVRAVRRRGVIDRFERVGAFKPTLRG